MSYNFSYENHEYESSSRKGIMTGYLQVIKERKMNGDVPNGPQSSGSETSINGVAATPSRSSAIRVPLKRSLDDYANR